MRNFERLALPALAVAAFYCGNACPSQHTDC